MAIDKPQNCTTRPGCKAVPTASFAWKGTTQFACGAHLPEAERVAKALGTTIDPQTYPPPPKPPAAAPAPARRSPQNR